MIYTIEGIGEVEKNGKVEVIRLIKIGYTSDDNVERRRSSYLSHFPLIKFKEVIPEGTEEHEKKLHRKFKDKKYSGYGNEWFEFDQGIVDYVSTVTLGELDQLPENPIRKKNSHIKITRTYDLCTEMLERRMIKDKVIIDFSKFQTKKDVVNRPGQFKEVEDLYKHFGLTVEEITEVERRFNLDLSQFPPSIQTFLNEFDRLVRYTDKMKYLCDEGIGFSEGDLEVIFRQIPLNFGQYYITLGPDRIKSYSYRKNALDKLYQSLMSPEFEFSTLDPEIYSRFEEGERYTLVELKGEIKEIFMEKGLETKGINAKTIENYFEAKEVLMPVLGGKRMKGYKLIKKLR